MQVLAGTKGITCVKLSEAEDLILSGIQDVLIANQIVEPLKIARAAYLASCCKLAVCVDSEENILMLEKAAAGYDNVIHCLIEYEVGMNRCGVVTKERVLELVGCISAQPHLFYIIIFGKFRIAPMGVRGVAIVTVVSQATAAIIGLYKLRLRHYKAQNAKLKTEPTIATSQAPRNVVLC